MKRLLALVPALALCLTLSACWESNASETTDFWATEPDNTAVEPEVPNKATVFTLPYLNSQTLDPVACSDGVQQVVGSLLYEGLFTLDERFTPQKTLCASYSCSSNGLTYTFTLRDDAVFSNGAALSANDVLAVYRRAQASERYAARFSNVASLRVSRGALIITLKQPDSALTALLDIPIVKSGTEKDPVPLGTGPYCLQTDENGSRLVRNEYWQRGTQLPLEQIALAPAKDADTAAYLFSAGQAHLLIADLLGESPAASIGGVDLADAPTTALLFLGCNVKRPAFSNAALRSALNLAVDRDAVVATLLAGHAEAAQFPISPRSALYPSALETPYESTGYVSALQTVLGSDAQPLELTLLVNEENQFKTSLAEHLARQLTAGPVTVTSVALPWTEYLAALESGSFDLWLGEVRLTADWDVTPLVGSGGALNYGGYSAAALDKALTEFRKDENETTAAALCELLREESPILPLVFKTISVLTPEGSTGGLSPTAAHPLGDLSQFAFRIPE